jgi:biopolymer transport protein ExbD
MMKLSRNVVRKARRNKRLAQVTSINLVSMIDIFTILIIYLLVNTAAVQVSGAEAVDLPKSIAEEQPKENLVVIIANGSILVDGRHVMTVDDAAAATTPTLPDLKSELLASAQLIPVADAPAGTLTRGDINIMADKTISYSLLKKVMATAADVRFGRISLGVLPKGNLQ